MSSMNYVILLGGLTRDPELRHTGGGQAIAKFSLAMSEKYKDKTGKETESVCYVDIVAWGKLGELVAEHLRKGSRALVQGKLQMEQWTAKDGTKRSKLSLRAFDVQFLSRPSPGNEVFTDTETSEPAWVNPAKRPLPPDAGDAFEDEETPF